MYRVLPGHEGRSGRRALGLGVKLIQDDTELGILFNRGRNDGVVVVRDIIKACVSMQWKSGAIFKNGIARRKLANEK